MTQSTINKKSIPWAYLLFNGLLSLIFVKQLFVLWSLHQNAIEALNSNILSSNPEILKQRIREMDPAWWSWAICIGALLVSLFFIIGWWVPKFKNYRQIFARISIGWTLVWIAYLVGIVVNTAIALNQFLA